MLSEREGAKTSQFGHWFLNWLIILASKLPMAMPISLVPPSPGGSGAFTLTAWNIRCRRKAGLSSAAEGLAKMGTDGCWMSHIGGDKGDGQLPPLPWVRVQNSHIEGGKPQPGGDCPVVERELWGIQGRISACCHTKSPHVPALHWQ